MRGIAYIGIVVLMLVPALAVSMCRQSDQASPSGNEMFEPVDTEAVMRLEYDMADMVEDIFSNQDGKIDFKVTRLSDMTDREVGFRSLTKDSVIYMYFTPLACWDCVKAVCGHLRESDYGRFVWLVMPESLSHASGRIRAEAGISDDRLYKLRGELGIPLEDDNRVFFFTVEEGGSGRIKNVFAPNEDIAVTDAYFDAVAGEIADN